MSNDRGAWQGQVSAGAEIVYPRDGLRRTVATAALACKMAGNFSGLDAAQEGAHSDVEWVTEWSQ